ncbi:E3 UFM1-protein ligase 1 [Apophysomyces sp. BC1015]|nr:E3 UFM1-protein ligase 1 [Apophysomyces sp. BC1015]
MSNLFVQFVEQGRQKGYIGSVFQTLDGESYLNEDHIHSLITKHVQEAGKLSVERIAEVLNIDQAAAQSALIRLLEAHRWTQVDDLVLTPAYIQSITGQLNVQIEKTGLISIVTEAQRFGLPHMFLYTKLDTMVSDREDYVKLASIPDLVLTQAYVDQTTQRITDALAQRTEPLSMLKLQRALELQEPLFYALLEQIAKNHGSGTFRGRRDRCIFEPHTYRDHQMALIGSLLEAGNYIEYQTVELHYSFGTPKDILRKLYPDIVLLETCAATQAVANELETKVEEVQITNSWLDVSKHVPFAFTSSDTAALLETILQRVKRKPKPVILGSRFVTTPVYLTAIVESAQKFLNRCALQYRELPTKKRAKHLHTPVEITEDEIYQYLVEQGAEEDFASCVAPVIKKPMREALAKAVKSVYLPSFDPWLSQQKERIQSVMQDTGCRIYYTYESVLLFKDDAARKSLEKYVVRQLCMEFLYYIVILNVMHNSDDSDAAFASLELTQEEIEDSARVGESRRTTIVARHAEHDELLGGLYRALVGGKKASAFINYIKDTIDTVKDEETKRKTNRDVLQSLARQLESTPVTEKSGPSILHLTSVLYFQSVYDLPLYVSGKYVPLILEQTKDRVGKNEVIELLCSSRDMIMACLKAGHPMDLSLIGQVSSLAKHLLDKSNI